MTKYKVVECFDSINGEASRAGELAYFVRFKGCNLSCSYCDTSWANEETAIYKEMTAEQIYESVKMSGIRNVTLTGGEPLMQEGIGELIKRLMADPKLSVEIETNGSYDIAQYISENPDARPVFTLDYKLPSSGMEIMMRASNFALLDKKDAVKFVAGDENDLIRARDVIDVYSLTEKCSVYISPVFGKIEPETIIEFMKENRMNGVKLQLQLHKIIWDPEKRGV